MHAASSFTGSKEARNRLTVDNIDHAALQVSNQAAHAACKSSKDHSKPRNEVDTSLKSPV